MRKRNVLLAVIFLISWVVTAAGFAAGQHEGHDPGATTPTTEDRLPGGKSHESNCQRVARLAAELDEAFDALVGISDPAELRSQLSRHRVKVQELRAATGICSQQCAQRPKGKGCGRMTRP